MGLGRGARVPSMCLGSHGRRTPAAGGGAHLPTRLGVDSVSHGAALGHEGSAPVSPET